MRKIIKTGLGIIVAFVVIYFIINASYEANIIYDLYISLDNKTSDSKANFDKKLYFVSTDENGNKIVTIGFQSETEYEAGVKRFGDAYDDGEENGSNDITNYNISGNGQAVIELVSNYPERIKLNSRFAAYVEQYGYVYDKLIEAGIPADYALGIIANLTSEGTVGMKQGTYNIITKSELESIVSNATSNESNSIGVGLMQWTYWSYMPDLLNRYTSGGAWNADGTLNINKALEVEAAWIVERALSSVSTAEGIANGDSTRYAEYWCDYHEKPSGWCAGSPKMRYCNGEENPGSGCVTRTERLKYLLEGMSN